VLPWLRRWRERDDERLVKRWANRADIDPLEELVRIVNEAQERDAEDERRLYQLMRGVGRNRVISLEPTRAPATLLRLAEEERRNARSVRPPQ
jgi:hypothetical protein